MPAGFHLRYRVDADSRRLVAESVDTSRFLAASGTGEVDVWEMHEDTAEPSIRPLDPPARLPAALTNDGRYLISSAGDAKLLVRDLENGGLIVCAVATASPAVAIQVALEGDVFLVLHENGTLRFFETAAGRAISSIDCGASEVVACPDVAHILLSRGDIAELRTREGLLVSRLHGLGDLLEARIARGGRRVVALAGDETGVRLRIWDGASGRPVFTVDQAITAAVSTNGAFVAAAVANGVVEIRQLETGKLNSSIVADPIAVSSISFCPSGGRIATIGTQGVAKIWDWRAGILVGELRLPEDASPDRYAQVLFSRTGNALSAGTDRWRAVWTTLRAFGEPHHYDDLAKTYDGLWSTRVLPVHAFATEAMRLEPGDRVLDLACGTGSLTLEMARRCPDGEVLAVDPSRGMLEAGRRLARSAGERVTFVQAKAEDFVATATPASFDAISLRFALDYFDWKRVLPRIASLARPGGRLVVVTSLRTSAPQLWRLYQNLMETFSGEAEPPSSVPESVGQLCEVLVRGGLEITDTTTWTTRLLFSSGMEAAHWLTRTGYVTHPMLTHEMLGSILPLIAAGLEEQRTPAGVPLDLVIACVAGARLA